MSKWFEFKKFISKHVPFPVPNGRGLSFIPNDGSEVPVARLEFDNETVRYKLKDKPEGYRVINTVVDPDDRMPMVQLQCRETHIIFNVPTSLFSMLFERIDP